MAASYLPFNRRASSQSRPTDALHKGQASR
jgi:hypothetical protein